MFSKVQVQAIITGLDNANVTQLCRSHIVVSTTNGNHPTFVSFTNNPVERTINLQNASEAINPQAYKKWAKAYKRADVTFTTFKL